MKKGGGKAKGSGFEREISRYLTEWLTGQRKKYYFSRSPGSGALATMVAANDDISSDIIALQPEAKIICDNFSVECKNGYAEASLDKHLKDNKNNTIEDFWIQVNRDAAKGNKNPMLIFKKKGNNIIWLGIGSSAYDKLKEYLFELKFVQLNFANGLETVYLFDMKKFFKIITPGVVKEIFCENKN